MTDNLYSRVVMVGLGSILLLSLAVNISKGLRADQKPAIVKPTKGGSFSHTTETPEAVEEKRVDAYTRMTAAKGPGPAPTMEAYYRRRAFPGAPPMMPHANFDERGIGAKSCLGCHRDGGFVSTLKAYAPVTPHPQFANCTSCHVPQPGHDEWGASRFVPAAHPVLEKITEGTAPPIPHPLDMRTNCLACHGTPATPTAIRTTHPERGECTLCHEAISK